MATINRLATAVLRSPSYCHGGTKCLRVQKSFRVHSPTIREIAAVPVMNGTTSQRHKHYSRLRAYFESLESLKSEDASHQYAVPSTSKHLLGIKSKARYNPVQPATFAPSMDGVSALRPLSCLRFAVQLGPCANR